MGSFILRIYQNLFLFRTSSTQCPYWQNFPVITVQKIFFLIKSARVNSYFSPTLSARKQKVLFTLTTLDHVEVSWTWILSVLVKSFPGIFLAFLVDVERNSDNTASDKSKPEQPSKHFDSPWWETALYVLDTFWKRARILLLRKVQSILDHVGLSATCFFACNSPFTVLRSTKGNLKNDLIYVSIKRPVLKSDCNIL